MSDSTRPIVAVSTTKAVTKAPENGTATSNPPAAQRQMLRIFALSGQSSWTPGTIASIVFGILMFLLGVIALWQNRNRKMMFVGGNYHSMSNLKDVVTGKTEPSAKLRTDIESYHLLPSTPYAHLVERDPDLWIPRYEPPREFVCIADPPDTHTNLPVQALGSNEPKNPLPKPQPAPKPPQPRDGYDLEVELTDMLSDNKSNDILVIGDQEPKKPAPKPKPKPPQPRDGYALGEPPSAIRQERTCILGGEGVGKPAQEPEPKPPQPLDGYGVAPRAMVALAGNGNLRSAGYMDKYKNAKCALLGFGMVVGRKLTT